MNLLARVSPDDPSPGALEFAHAREIDVGFARVRAARMSHVGGPGFELYVPIEMARLAYLALDAAGQGLGLRDAGYDTLDALRIEAGRRAWGAELDRDETPFEAGLMHAVRLDKPADLLGKAALLAARGEPLRSRLVTVVLGSAQHRVWGGEALLIDGQAVGELSSVGWSVKAQACVGLGYLRGASAQQVHRGTAPHVDLWGEAVGATAWDRPGVPPGMPPEVGRQRPTARADPLFPGGLVDRPRSAPYNPIPCERRRVGDRPEQPKNLE